MRASAECILVKLQELVIGLGVPPQSLLEDQVSFATVALVLVLLRPGDVERRLCHSYPLCSHVPVDFQGLGAILGLMAQMNT